MATGAAVVALPGERWDGQGYPQGLKGEAIPLPARIVAVADAFDALTHARPYKEAWPLDEALAELQQERGWQFDPQVVDVLLRSHRGGQHIVHVPKKKSWVLWWARCRSC